MKLKTCCLSLRPIARPAAFFYRSSRMSAAGRLHLRFGWLTYVKCTEKTTTSIKLSLDRFIGEVLPDPPRQAKAHLISVIGGDTQISAISAAISMTEKFMVEGPDV